MNKTLPHSIEKKEGADCALGDVPIVKKGLQKNPMKRTLQYKCLGTLLHTIDGGDSGTKRAA